MNMLKLKPAFKDYLWGGTRLRTEYEKECEYDIIAESWELSNHSAGASIIDNGNLKGVSFTQYLEDSGKKVWGSNAQHFQNFPILIKFIDAKQALSIQVHPDDEYALRVEKEFGKNEMWYVLDAEPGSFLYYGVNKEITKEEYRTRVENNTFLDVLNKVEVKKGDCFFIEAGTIHALGEGIIICEVQQNSNTTYRVYDFGRVGVDGNPRELHIDKAVEVSTLTPVSTEDTKGQAIKLEDNTLENLATSQYFTCDKYEVENEITLCVGDESFQSIIMLEGTGDVTCGNESVTYKKGDSVFFAAGSGEFTVRGKTAFILSRI